MKNYVQPGRMLTLLAPYTVASGAGAKVGAIFGVATGAVTSGASGEFETEGVHTLAKHDSQAWLQGDRIYWDDSNKWASNVATDGMLIGYAPSAVAATAGLITGNVKLLGSAADYSEGQQAAIAALTDSSGGTSGGNTVGAITGVDGTASNAAGLVTTKNALATLAAKINAIQAALHAAGITG